jgi:7,8-dihydroneopterin aldolase/epimerase/oxygenase
MDQIEIEGLDLPTRIGVPDDERARWQSIQADITLTPSRPWHEIDDSLSSTVDYAAVALHARDLAADRPRQLLETLANELASSLLQHFPLREVDICLRKRIVPGTTAVAVRLSRRAPRPPSTP